MGVHEKRARGARGLRHPLPFEIVVLTAARQVKLNSLS
jgi:hypothetical protein